MAKTYYQVLGVTATSKPDEIRSAYRKLVLLHHPDRSSDPKSKAIFLAVAEAYEVLSDPERRRTYDERLALEKKIGERRKASQAATAHSAQTPSGRLAEIKLDVNRLNALFSRGNFIEAEKLARTILDRDRRQPIPYAVLGDIAQMSGNAKEAVKMYAYACQFDPKNTIYQRRYDELAGATYAVADVRREEMAPKVTPPKQGQLIAPFFGLGLVMLAGAYIALAKETPIFPELALISTWSLGLVVMLFFSGVAMASSMSLDGMLGSFHSLGRNSYGRTSPWVALASIAVVNFWAATALYVLIGATRRAFNVSTSRIIACVVAGTCVMAFASEISGSISGIQVVAWGGNLVYLGAVCGWMVTDALKNSGQ